MYYTPFTPGNFAPTLRDLEQSGMEIFNDWWTTYVPEYKPVLIQKIMHTYYFEQIGAETPDQFVHYINAQLERIMPYYNQLYASELLKINPLVNYELTQRERTIENLLTKANTTDDKVSKAIRDFAGITDKSGIDSTTGESISENNKDDRVEDDYIKYGDENIIENRNLTGNETEKGNSSTKTDGSTEVTEDENGTIETNKNNNTTETEKFGEGLVEKMQWGGTETTTEQTTGTETTEGTGTRRWTEVKDDDSTTDSKTSLDETTITSGEKDYSDTPQKNLNVNGDGTSQIRKDYLTTVTWDSSDTNHTATTDQSTTFTDDQTITHDEDTTDNTSTEKNTEGTTEKSKGGIDIKDTSKTGQNVTETIDNEDSEQTTDNHKTSSTITDDTATVNSTKETDTKDTEITDTDKDWREAGGSNTVGSSTSNTVDNIKKNTSSTGTSQTRENSSIDDISTSIKEEKSEETTDKGSTQITTGYMNVSASALLEAFRRTFLNIDNMIIEELRENFMLVY